MTQATVTSQFSVLPKNQAGRRVLLKLSGEAFGGGAVGVDPDIVSRIAGEIAEATATGVQCAIVVGGGNFFRGAELSQRGMDRRRADYMGMLGTVMNAITMGQVAEPYLPLRAVRHLEKGRVVIFGAGAGMPYFSTDTVAVQRALEIGCQEVLMAKNGVDGVYTADPRIDPTATKLEHITYADALQKGLKVVDSTAFSLCMDNAQPMMVFGLDAPGAITAAMRGERIGTLVTGD
jgi:uridylate kinase